MNEEILQGDDQEGNGDEGEATPRAASEQLEPRSAAGQVPDTEGADVQPHDVEPGQPRAADDLEEDTEDKRVSRDPGAPSRSEREEHNIDHTPYRSWCEDCVRGRGLGEQHKSSGSTRALPVVSFDYLFITQGQILLKAELEQADAERPGMLKILVVKDLKSKSVFAHVVDRKGIDADGYAVTRLVQDIKWLG